ncbi:branched-chain amino acid ABC transporter permease [Microbacterium sp. NPDC058021]|uniref:branched-chain amino acid ABC transporter permease n=1 Tax=Microbacterium sp. NPDC058021 TaxID=3346306 RepID=UPI0036DABA2A
MSTTTLRTQRELPRTRLHGRRRPGFWVEIAASALVILLPSFVASPYLMRLFQDVAIWSILALSLTLVLGFTGQISLGQAAFYAVGAYTSVILQTALGVPALLAWVVAIVLGMALAYLISVPLLRIHGHFLALGTLALGLIVETLLVQLAPITGGHDGIRIPGVEYLGEWMQLRFPYIVLGTLVAAYWLVRNLTQHSMGRAFFALRDDPAGAAALGIPVARYKTLVFMIGGGLAATAGVLYAHHTQVVTPDSFGFDTSIEVLLIVIIGGMSSRLGAVVGAVVIVFFPEWLVFLEKAENLVFGLVVLAILLFLPGGVVGGVRTFFSGLARRRETHHPEVAS